MKTEYHETHMLYKHRQEGSGLLTCGFSRLGVTNYSTDEINKLYTNESSDDNL